MLKLRINLFLKSNFLEDGTEKIFNSIEGKVKKVKETKQDELPEGRKLSILDESKSERQELSNDLLASISNKEFLKQPLEKRLQYVTDPKVDYDSVVSGKVKSINFTFTFDGKFNRDLYLKTTAGQVLPREVSEIKIGDEVYSRSGIAGEFFNGNSRLIIREGTRIEILKVRSKEDLEKIKRENTKIYNDFIKENPTANQAILQEAILRGIDPKFAILAFEDAYSAAPDSEKKVILEDMMTDFDRYRGYFGLSKEQKNGKYDARLALGILSKYNKENWEEKALKYGIAKKEIDDYKSDGEIYMSMQANDIENGDSLPDGTYLKGDRLLQDVRFKEKLESVCKRIGARFEDMVKLMKAESGLDPRAVNPQSGATGLIQFMPDTAISLGTTVGKIRAMTGVEQLDLVQKYFEKNSFGADLSDITKLYQAVFYPYSLTKPMDYVYGSHDGTSHKIAIQNSGIARFSSRADGLIDGYAFSRYVKDHVSKISV